jgi:hypothetical protein
LVSHTSTSSYTPKGAGFFTTLHGQAKTRPTALDTHTCISLLLKNLQENRSPGRAKTTGVIHSTGLDVQLKRKESSLQSSHQKKAASNHGILRSCLQSQGKKAASDRANPLHSFPSRIHRRRPLEARHRSPHSPAPQHRAIALAVASIAVIAHRIRPHPRRNAMPRSYLDLAAACCSFNLLPATSCRDLPMPVAC